MKKNKTEIEIKEVSIIKHVLNKREFIMEMQVYQKRLPYIPQMVSFDEQTLTMEMQRIKGVPIGITRSFSFYTAGTILKRFYEDTGLIHYDTNPRNYIIEEDSKDLYMIDFSESRKGDYGSDAISFLLHWADILDNEMFKKAAKELLSGYSLESSHLCEEMSNRLVKNEIRRFDTRKKEFSPSYQIPEVRQPNRKELKCIINELQVDSNLTKVNMY